MVGVAFSKGAVQGNDVRQGRLQCRWKGPELSASSDPMSTLMTSVSLKMTTEKSVVAEAESPPQDQKQEGKEQEEEGACKSVPEEIVTGDKPETVETQGSPSTDSPSTRRSKDRNSEGKRLSRLFSSFLKRPKSQVTEEDKDVQSSSEKGAAEQKELDEGLGEQLDDDVFLKAPIAAPEPELRTDPSLDLHSLSSAETQPAQEDRKDDQDPEANPEDEEDTVEVNSEQKLTKTEDSKSSQKVVRRSANMRCKVTLLDDTVYECELEKHAKGQDLFKKVCSHLNILEEDYFGLAIWESPSNKTWIDAVKDIRKQVHGAPWDFTFNVKFYPPDPAQLTEDITRYFLCLQLRQDILSGRLPCSFATLALLGSYTVQSEVGDYDEDLHGTDYVSEFKLSPNQTKDLEAKVAELHKSYRSMTPAQADLEFLENAKKLTMYGVDIHQAKDLEGVDIKLGVCSGGLMVFKDNLRINRFPWPKVLKISYKRSSFFIKIRPGEQEQYESTIGFKLPSYRAAKKLWKVCVEHHTFFRLTSTETIPKNRLLSLGSKFRYSGRTQAQTRHASALIDRPAPQFERTASKRATRSLDGVKKGRPAYKFIASEEDNDVEVIELKIPIHAVPATVSHKEEIELENIDKAGLKKPEEMSVVEQTRKIYVETEQKAAVATPERNARPVSAPVIAQSQIVIQPARSREESSTKNEEKKPQDQVKEPRSSPKEAKTPPQKNSSPTVNGDQAQQPAEKEEEIIRMRKDLEKTQDEIIRHHASIRELKKSFMESVPAPRPSEWDKRLSSHSPFRTFSFNGQVQTGSDGPPLVKTQTVTISNASTSEKGQIPTKEVPLVHTETKTITYEAAKNEDVNFDQEPSILLAAHTITSETTSSTTTTQITKTVKGGISETRIEKRIVITGDGDLDHDQVLVQAIKEAKEQHPDMSVTKVVVHQETEIAEE
ncbi:protein 4.1-like isoform X2 [Bufo gargarizans]|uniref:protein 4.1-like isoform X2 n=1 Tax=Bufo gargarizans TaxID=30331 RepID=UPI001CF25CA5|nr:protein 4.1-like isoform X2 [Bufo gargarizans]